MLGEQKAPSSEFTWIDSISSTDPCHDSLSLLPTQGFATSESIALSSTEGFIRNNHLPQEEAAVIRPTFLQRVPQLVREFPCYKINILVAYNNL